MTPGYLAVKRATTAPPSSPAPGPDAARIHGTAWTSDTSLSSIQGQRFATAARLEIPTPIQVSALDPAEVPVSLLTSGQAVAAVVFSLDYDAGCLDFDPTDMDADGLPDAVTFLGPADFDVTVFFDLGDTDGEIDVTIADVLPPVSALADGPLLDVTFTPTCTPPIGAPLLAAVGFSSDPAASFSDPLAQALTGSTVGGAVEIYGGARGDCNGNGLLDAPDLVASGLEIFDSDGNFAFDTPQGTFLGNPIGCDANADTLVDAGDLSCNNRLFFGLTCGVPATLGLTGAGPRLLLYQESTEVGWKLSVVLEPEGHDLNALAFSLDYDETLFDFDPTDADGDGTPDAVHFPGPPRSMQGVSFAASDTAGELDFLLADLVAAPQIFPGGTLVEVDLQPLAPGGPTGAGASFSREPAASFGDLEGRSIAGGTEEVPVPLFADGFESGDTSAWSGKVGQ